MFVYAWIGPLAGGAGTAATPNGYYALLTEAFLSGQTHLKAKPDPSLKLLENPWAGYQGIPRLHDATYYKDRYYLYFSFVPAALVGVPWKLLTGHYLNDGAMTAIGGSIGLLLGGLFLISLWKRWFATLSPGWLVGGIVLLAIGSNLPALLQSFAVYPVPITGAFACSMAALGAVFWAIITPQPRRRLCALALASLAWGLEVACRPNHLFSVAGLAVAGLYLFVHTARGHGLTSRPARLTFAAAFAPVAVIGAIIAAYNYARFGSIAEFGIINMFSGGDSALFEVVSWRNVPENLRTLFLHPSPLSPYFPFVVVPGEGLGLLTGNPFAWLAFLWPLTLLRSAWRRDAVWVVLGLVLGAALLGNLVGVAIAPGINERYRADFMPQTVLLALLTAYGFLHRPPGTDNSRGTRWMLRAIVSVLGTWSAGAATLVLFFHYTRPQSIQPLARLVNHLPHWVEKARGLQFGSATMTVRFPKKAPGVREPLTVSGHGRDILYVDYLRADHIQIGFFHLGAGGPISRPIPITPGKEYRLGLDLGCFYPPNAHPLLAAWDRELIPLLARRLHVTLDDESILHSGSAFYSTHPGDVHFGTNPGPHIAAGRFTGTLGYIQRAGIPSPATVTQPGPISPVRLTLRFPPFVLYKTEPLVSTGRSGAGDLLYVSYVAPGKLRFGHDSWGGGAIETGIVDYDPAQPYKLEVDMPAMAAATSAAGTGKFLLRFNSELLISDDRPRHPSLPAEFYLGFNGMDSSAVAMNFSGQIERVEKIPPLSVTAERFQLEPGPVRMVLRFPPGPFGLSEPLLVTGRAGTADIVFVHYVDATHIRIGYDHWSVGGPLSDLIPIDYTATQTLEIQTGALYPAIDDDAAWGGTSPPQRQAALSQVVVKLNGQPVLHHQQAAFRSEPADILVGLNSVGASTCARIFLGKIYVKERLGLAPATP